MSRYLERAGVARALKVAIATSRRAVPGPDRDGRATTEDESRPAGSDDPAAWRIG